MPTTATRKNRLTSNNAIGTLSQVPAGDGVDATSKKLLAKQDELERARWKIDQELRAVRMALNLVGVRPSDSTDRLDHRESEYYVEHTFTKMTLGEACERILKDFNEQWLSKSQIEYLITRGGYQFSAKDSKNSVGVTLQRLADSGKCGVERVRGARGNRYRWISRFPREKKDEKLVSQ